MPLPLADVWGLVGAEADDYRHGLPPDHAEGLGLVLLQIEAGIHGESFLGDRDRVDPVDGQTDERIVDGDLADAVEEALNIEEAIRIEPEAVRLRPPGGLVADQTPTLGDDGFHELQDDVLEGGVVLDPARPAVEDAAQILG
ncbi:MAG: hypothetical protein WCI75_17635, partial [candidate division NC10 bacterium]